MTLLLEQQTVVPEAIQIVVADNRPLDCGFLGQGAEFGATEIRGASDFASLHRVLAGGQTPDLILLDLATPGVGGMSGLLYLRARHPGLAVVVVSASEDYAVMRRCIEAGAAGYIPKCTDPETAAQAISMILAGEIWTPADLDAVEPAEMSELMRRMSQLTPQQLRVLMMLTQGLLNKQIAYELKVSEATIKAHVSAILQKLDVDNRTQAVAAVSKLAGGCCGRNVQVARARGDA